MQNYYIWNIHQNQSLNIVTKLGLCLDSKTPYLDPANSWGQNFLPLLTCFDDHSEMILLMDHLCVLRPLLTLQGLPLAPLYPIATYAYDLGPLSTEIY